MEFRPLLEHRCSCESPVWDDRRQCLFFVDFTNTAVRSVKLDGSAHRHWPMPELPSSIGLGESGRLIVAQPKSLLVLDPDTGETQLLASITGEPADNRLNDGKVGPDGAFWVGSMDMRPVRERLGSLFRVDGQGNVALVLHRETEISNGLAWSDDGSTMYFSDSRGPWVDRFDFDPVTGVASNRARLVELTEALGRPDGAACDVEGRYWSAGVSAGRLNIIGADGAIERVIPLPVAAPTMPAFCGPGLDKLAVTSLLPASPQAHDGAVLIADAPIRGARVHRRRDV